MRKQREFKGDTAEADARLFAANITSPWGHEQVVIYEARCLFGEASSWVVSWVQWSS